MKRCLLLVCLLVSSPAFAEGWKPIVGATAKFDFIINGNSWDVNPAHWWVVRLNRVSQFDVGVRKDKHEFYVAYHLSNSTTDRDFFAQTVWYDTTKREIWNNYSEFWESSKRAIAGYRFWPIAATYPIVPVVGAAIGVGQRTFHYSCDRKLTQSLRDPDTHSWDYRVSKKSMQADLTHTVEPTWTDFSKWVWLCVCTRV